MQVPRQRFPQGPKLFLAVTLLTAGCSTTPERIGVPEAAVNQAVVEGYDGIRLWSDDHLSADEQQRWLSLYTKAARKRGMRTSNYLVVSGGGGDGAFGAGFLTGWSETETRPKFDIVTGISIGALVAPFAYLGPAYDDRLEQIFASYHGYDFYAKDNIKKVIAGQLTAADNPLRRDIERHIDEALLDAIAAEYAGGRLLFVGTTNLDAQRTMMWNLGAIAASRQPDRRALFVDVLLAAASIPVVLPAVPIRVTVDGEAFEELHVDAGTQTEAFFAPPQVSMRNVDRALGYRRNQRLYIIRNDKIVPEYEATNGDAFNVARRSLSTLLKAHAVADLYRIYAIAKRDGISYHLVSIPGYARGNEFDTRYMREVFELGRRLAGNGRKWQRVPPGLKRN